MQATSGMQKQQLASGQSLKRAESRHVNVTKQISRIFAPKRLNQISAYYGKGIPSSVHWQPNLNRKKGHPLAGAALCDSNRGLLVGAD